MNKTFLVLNFTWFVKLWVIFSSKSKFPDEDFFTKKKHKVTDLAPKSRLPTVRQFKVQRRVKKLFFLDFNFQAKFSFVGFFALKKHTFWWRVSQRNPTVTDFNLKNLINQRLGTSLYFFDFLGTREVTMKLSFSFIFFFHFHYFWKTVSMISKNTVSTNLVLVSQKKIVCGWRISWCLIQLHSLLICFFFRKQKL